MSEKLGFLSYLRKSIPMTIWVIGLSSLLINVSTSVVFSGTALYLKTVLDVKSSSIGLLEALVEAIAYAVRIFAGVVSDYFKKRKALMVIGFILVAIAKPLLAFSKTFAHIFLARAVDRLGNGIQASPREALISDSAPKNAKGACFGLRQSLALIGSTIGGIFGVIVMKTTNNNFQSLFLLAGIPAFVAVIVLILFVKEKADKSEPHQERRKIKIHDMKLLGSRFWLFMLVVAIFMMGRFSEVFIALHACGNFGLDVSYGTAITLIYNLMSTMISYPIGRISDKMDRTILLLLGFILLLVSHIVLGFAVNLGMVFFGSLTWGLQTGISQSLFATLVSDYIPKDLRGTGFGIYYLVVSASTAIASVLAGVLSEKHGEGAAFIAGSVFAIISIILLVFFRKWQKSNPEPSI